MKKFKVTIEETVSDEFEVTAENAVQAYKSAQEKYRQGKIVLEPGNLTAKQMMITDAKDRKVLEWTEF